MLQLLFKSGVVGVVTSREKWITYAEDRIGLGLDRNFIHFWLGFIKGLNKIVKAPMGQCPLPDLGVGGTYLFCCTKAFKFITHRNLGKFASPAKRKEIKTTKIGDWNMSTRNWRSFQIANYK
jgi:hypothetical protein